MEKELLAKLKEQLSDLYFNREIYEGKRLTQELRKIVGDEFYLNFKVFPSYNFLNLYKETVFCHLNPGGNPDVGEFYNNEILKSKDVNDFIDKYVAGSINYPQKRFIDNRGFDNFDFKQALYLSGFTNNGIEFSSKEDIEFKNKENQSKDCFNVLTQKTQLELIPYQSSKFSRIFTSQKISDKLLTFIKPYFEELLNIITLRERKYVIFGSTQYEQIFKSYNKINPIILERTEKFCFDIGVTKKAYFSMYKIKWNNKEFYAGVAHSFARQDLPNAFKQMKTYGELSAKKYHEFVNKSK